MMTEDEAKTKWCPFARLATPDGGVNRWKQSLPEDEPYALNPVPCRCIGHACMAWRWQEVSGPFPSAVEVLEEPPYGYCGLAGRPA